MADADADIMVEVAYALPERQAILRLQVPSGTTAREAVQRSAISTQFPDAAVERCPLGIFGKAVPDGQVLEAGDRVEIYRPLIADPKEARRARALRDQGSAEGSMTTADSGEGDGD
jgi:uncharacterized protein